MRVVDFGEPGDAGFPAKLFATHLLALASAEKDARQQVDLLEKAVRIYPGEESPETDEECVAEDNPGNYFCWELLGHAYHEVGRDADGLGALQTARVKWPWGAARTAEIFCEQIEKGDLPSPDVDSRSRFWMETRRLSRP